MIGSIAAGAIREWDIHTAENGRPNKQQGKTKKSHRTVIQQP